MATNPKADLKKALPIFAKNLSSIKLSLTKLVKNKEYEKKQRGIDRQKQRASDYASKYKKTPTPAEKKVVAQEKKPFLESIKDFFAGLLKFLVLGLGAIGLSKLLSNPAVTSAITNFLKKVFIGLSEALQKGMQVITNLINDPEVFASIQKMVKDVFMFIGKLVVKGSEFIRELVTDPQIQDTIKNVLVGIITTVKEIITSVFNVGKQLVSENREVIKTTIIDVIVGIANAFVKVLKIGEEVIKDPEVKGALVKIAYAIRDAIRTIFNAEFEVAGVKTNLKEVLLGLGIAIMGFGLALTYLQGRIIGGMVGDRLSGGRGKSGKANAAGMVLDVAALAGTGYLAYETFIKDDPSAKQFERYAGGNTTTAPTKVPTVPSTVQSASSKYYDPSGGGVAIREVIGAGEGGKTGYNATYGFGYGKQDPKIEEMFGKGKKLTDLTIGQVLQYAAQRKTNQGAVGKYQFMPDTLKGLVTKSSAYGIDFNTKFTPETQDKLYGIFSQKNIDILKKNNIAITPENIHLAHSVGASGAVKLLTYKDQNANILDVLGLKGAEAKTNPHLNTSIASYRSTLSAKYGGEGGTTLALNKPIEQKQPQSIPTNTQTAPTLASADGKEPPPKVSGGMISEDKTESAGEPKSMMETLMTSLSQGMAGLDKATGGKLGLASISLQEVLRDKSFLQQFQSPIFADASKNINSVDNVALNEKTPSVYDEVLLSKLVRT